MRDSGFTEIVNDQLDLEWRSWVLSVVEVTVLYADEHFRCVVVGNL